jgi:tRNA/rRNA methyltransferase
MLSVAVIGAKTSGNLGAISRIMANFGLKDLYLINPDCEIITDESRARAMRSIKILENAKVIRTLSQIKADYLIATTAKLASSSNIHRIYLTPKELAKNFDSSLHYCIVLGREDKGLFNEEIKQCDILLHIPTHKDYKVLNISHSLAIILYELSCQDNIPKKLANKREKNAVFLRLDSLKNGIENYDKFREVFVNIINRSMIRKKEARALAGLLKKIQENKEL